MENLEDFLQTESSNGEHDSSGIFTMSVDRASWKLAQFQLASLSLFPVHLAACAVASRATVFRTTFKGRSARFYFNGGVFSVSELELLSQPLLANNVPARIRELGIAISAASGSSQVKFFSVAKGRGLKLTVDSGEVVLEEFAANDLEEGQVLLVEDCPRNFNLTKLKERCHLAPLDLTINGERHRTMLDFGMSNGALYAMHRQQGRNELMVRSARLASYEVAHREVKAPENRSFCVGLTEPETADETGWVFLCNGVTYKPRKDPFGLSLICGAVDCSDLEKDLSQSSLLANDEYQAMLDEVRRGIRQLIEDNLQALRSLPDTLREGFLVELIDFYQDQPAPPALRELASQSSSGPSKALVERASKKALETGDWQELEAIRNSIHRHIAQSYRRRGVKAAVPWLEKEKLLLKNVGADPAEVEEQLFYLNAMSPQGPQVANPPLVPGSSPALRRALFHRLGQDSFDSLQAEIRPLQHKEPLADALAQMLDLLYHDVPLKTPPSTVHWLFGGWLWAQCLKRNFDKVRLALKGSPNQLLWEGIILTFFAGHIPFTTHVAWSIGWRFEMMKEGDSLTRKTLQLVSGLRRNRSNRQEYLLKTELQNVLFPLTYSHIMARGTYEINWSSLSLLRMPLILESMGLKAPGSDPTP